MIHLDLFSGIGGFSIAAEQVWGDVEHTFCDSDRFCREVLKKHWPEAKIYDDIKNITNPFKADLVTGGFPCQPFSQVGQRRGTDDSRYLWPEMYRVIQLTKPTWVIAENVLGLTTWNDGLVLETVCADLEAGGYTVQAFVIPAAGVGAPHKRDRAWICAHANGAEYRGKGHAGQDRAPDSLPGAFWQTVYPRKLGGACEVEDWIGAATRLCGVDDGLPAGVGDFTLTAKQHRTQQLKAYGNAIVPQVAAEIMRAML